MKAPTVTIKWDRRALAKLAINAIEGTLQKAGQYLRTKVVKNVSVPTSTHGPSSPGEFPHADTGRLRASIFVKTVPDTTLYGQPVSMVIVGTSLRYGLFHEYLSGRSYLRRTLREELPALRRFFKGASVNRQ